MSVSRARVLLVEDNPDHADLIGGALTDAGHEVRHVLGGDEARAEMDDRSLDLLLLDYTLTGETGFDVLRHARSVRPELPVVLLTGRDDEELVLEAMHLGAADFLVKSFDRSFMRVLPLYVAKNLERARLGQALALSEVARERSEAYLRLLMDSLDAAVLGVDDLFQVTDANRAWADLAVRLGAPAGDPVGRRLDQLVGEGSLRATLNAQRTALALGEAAILRREVSVSGPAGDLELEVESTPLAQPGRGDGVVFVLTDVTERHRARREEAEMSRRLSTANEELERLVKARGALVTGVSRELRSPAQSIGGFAQMLGSGALGELSAEAVRAASVVGRGAERLAHLADDLDYLAGGEGDPRRPQDARDLLQRALAVGVVERRARKIRVRSDAPEGLALEVDPAQVVSVLSLLLADVTDDARSRSAILAGAQAEGDHLTFAIEADGATCGGPDDLRMVVAREVVRRHGGRLEERPAADAASRGGWRLTLPVLQELNG